MTTNSTTKYIDYLTEDRPLSNQSWVCLSFLSPEGIKNCSVRGIKVRGVYSTQEEAKKRADELQKEDPDFHVFVGEVGKWLAWDPDPNDADDQVYRNKELNDLMKGYKANIEKSRRAQEEYKNDKLRQAALEEQMKQSNSSNNNHDVNDMRSKLQKKLEAKRQNKKLEDQSSKSDNSNNSNKEKELKELQSKLSFEEQTLQKEKQKLDDTTKKLDESNQVVSSIDEKLTKIQQLYDKLQNKNK